MRKGKAFYVRGDANALPFPDEWFHSVVTSIPYFAQRTYGDDHARELGCEETPQAYVSGIVRGFREVRRVLRADGTLWLNVGDTYAGNQSGGTTGGSLQGRANARARGKHRKRITTPGIESKELIGIPWMLTFAMRADGWRLRQEIIWAKAISFGERHAETNREAVRRAAVAKGVQPWVADEIAAVVTAQVGSCMPGSAPDRCTTSHETVFVFTRSERYYFDQEAVKEKGRIGIPRNKPKDHAGEKYNMFNHGGLTLADYSEKGRNLRTVWTINPQPVRGSDHYAAYPSRLVQPCVKAGTSEKGCCPICGAAAVRVVERVKVKRVRPNKLTKRTGAAGTGNVCANDVDGVQTKTLGWRAGCGCMGIYPEGLLPCRVLDPFGGSGTTARAANKLGRDCVVVDLYEKYLLAARERGEEISRESTLRNSRKRVASNPNQMDLFAVPT